MNKKFLTAFILPDEWEIVGYKLKPYSIRKYLSLVAVNSPYVNGQVPTALDTLKFLKFCSSNCKSIIDISGRDMRDTIAYLRLKYDRKFHTYVIKAIINYITEYTSTPKIRIVNKSTKQTLVDNSSLPDMLVLASVCMSKLKMDEDKVLDMPIAKLNWYAGAVAQINGSDVAVNDIQDEIDANSDKEILLRWEKEQAEKIRLAMVNGKIPVKRIKIRGQ